MNKHAVPDTGESFFTDPRRKCAPDPATGALVAESESFFAVKVSEQRPAIKLCGMCPFQDPCLAYALRDTHASGVWGGTTERERSRLRKLRKVMR